MRQVMERFRRGGEATGEAEVSAAAAVKRVRRMDFIVDGRGKELARSRRWRDCLQVWNLILEEDTPFHVIGILWP